MIHNEEYLLLFRGLISSMSNVALLVFFAYLFCMVNSQACKPYAVRLSLGENYVHQESESMISVWFNTAAECPFSYVYIEQAAKIAKYSCDSRIMPFPTHITYSHKCIITKKLIDGEKYEYMAYGLSKQGDVPIPSHSHNIESRVPSKTSSLRILVLADWSFLIQKVGIYDSLDQSMDYLIQNDLIDLLYVNGDIAYDLSSNDGKNYEDFIRMLSQIGVKYPVIMTTGNHERKTVNDTQIFVNSFEVFDLVEKNITTIDLGVANLVIFDPFEIVIDLSTQGDLSSRFRTAMAQAQKERKPIITSSHYPLACSGSSPHCKNERYLLQDFFQTMIDTNSVFYLGSHYHTYERLYPFVGKGNFDLKSKNPYSLTPTSKFLLAVTEGISGNDDHIVESYKSIQPFTADLSFNKTGFGIMTVSKTNLSFQHFLATDPINQIDALNVDYSQLFSKPESKYIRTEQ